MNVPADLSEMLKAKKSEIDLNHDLMQKFKDLSLETKNDIEEFPKLRKPKAATMLKIQQEDLRKAEKVHTQGLEKFTAAKNINTISNVPLRQEFLIKKEIMEKAATDVVKKYVSVKSADKLMDKYVSSQDVYEPKPITLDKGDFKDFELKPLEMKEANVLNTPKSKEIHLESLTYTELHLVNILYTKIKAHPNGFFANNIPNWYKTTFDKELPTNWLDLLKKSQKFCLDNINTKIVLFALEEDNQRHEIDTHASGDSAVKTKFKYVAKPIDKTESFTGFVRYKHLEKSLQNYKNYAGRGVCVKKQEVSVKPSDRINKSGVAKSNVRYGHLQGP